MELRELLLIVSTAVSIGGIVYSFIATILKSNKSKYVKLGQILQMLPAYIQEAETIFGAKTGVAKRAYVLNKVNMDCINDRVDFNAEEWTNAIEDILTAPQKKNNI